ncbi:MAG TPA: polyketide synthase, partial [Acidobacteria bacterium]|nr:polyketide synthase [Acidobacteriota bacterium]
PAAAPRPAAAGAQILPLSAKSPSAVQEMMRELAEELGRRPDLELDDVAFTLQVGRNAWKYRAFVVCDSLASAAAGLAAKAGLPAFARNEAETAVPVFVFPGQGAQVPPGLVRDLRAGFSGFRRAFDECAETLLSFTDWDLRDLTGVDLEQTAVVQPLLFSVEYALARLWESLGVRPAALLGHSLGEYVAACLAGVFSLPEVLSLVVVRGQLMQSLPPGQMMAVRCGERELAGFLAGSACSLAAVNGPRQCVVSGGADDIAALLLRLEAADVPGRLLRTSHAFHSAMMDPILDTYEECVAAVERRPPAIPFLSSRTGTWITDEQAMSPSYWARHLRETVRFGDGARELLRQAGCVALEAGPGHTLSALLQVAGAPEDRVVPTFGGTGSGGRDGRYAVLEAAGRLWLQGVEVDWARLHEERQPGRVPLPTYRFDRRRYWIDRGAGTPGGAEPAAAQPQEDLTTYDRPEMETAYAEPSHDVEVRLAAIWRGYLGIEKIGVKDNFFTLGGDSLLATRVHAHIKRDFGIELPMGKMFELATVRRQSLFVIVSRDPAAIDALGEEDLNDLLAVMEP